MTNLTQLNMQIQTTEAGLSVATRRRIIEIAYWPKPDARFCIPGQTRWRDFAPKLDTKKSELHLGPLLGLQKDERQMLQAYLGCKLLSQVPEHVQNALEIYHVGSDHTIGQWEMLKLAAKMGDRFVDLMHSTPVLAWILAHRLPPNLSQLVSKPQVRILDALQFPATKSTMKLLRKMSIEDIHLPILDVLRYRLAEPDILKPLQHVRRITRSVLEIVLDDALRNLVKLPFLEEVSQTDNPNVVVWVRDVYHNLIVLDQPVQHIQLGSLSELWSLQDRLSQMMALHQKHKLAQVLADGRAPVAQSLKRARSRKLVRPKPVRRPDPFAPPIPGTDAIRPLTNALVIRFWADMQHNCLASRIPRVKKGDYFLYQILKPEQASLAILRKGYRWEIAELKGKYNHPVQSQTRGMVETWLKEHQGNRN